MKKTHLAAGFMVALLLTVITANSSFAYFGDRDDQNKNFDSERFEQIQLERTNHREIMRNAMESGDYNTWKTTLENSPRGVKMLEIINEDNFSKLKEAHQLAQSGDYEGAKAIRDELGLQKGLMRGTNQRRGMRDGTRGMNRSNR